MSIWKRLRESLGGTKAESEINAELESHIELRAEQYMAEGMTPGEARRAARRQFGNRLQIQEDTRSFELFPALETLRRELRHALRGLSSRPGLVTVAIASLALGIGANAVLFSAMDAVFWKPLPLKDPERLVEIQQLRNGERTNGNPERTRDYHAQLKSVEGVGGTYGESTILPTDAGPRRVVAQRTFGPMLTLFGIETARGRRFTAEEERGAPVAILTDRFWRDYFSADQAVLGKPLVTKTGTYTIIGVLPPTVPYPRDADFWAPATKALQEGGRRASFLSSIARLRPGATLQTLTAELQPLHASLAKQYPDTDTGLSASVGPLADDSAPHARQPILLAWAAVAVVLLIACLNLASLLLARGFERQREATIRAALGASRWTLVRTFLTESFLLAAGGAVAGLLLAGWGVDLVASYLPSTNPIAVDYRVVLFSFALALGSALFFGLVPAWQTARAGLAGNLNELSRSSGNARRLWLRGLMVVAQTALSLFLLGAAGLLLASFQNQRSAPLGFTPERLLATRINLSWDSGDQVLHGFIRQSLERLRALPGVEDVGLTDRLPLEGESQSGEVLLRARELDPQLAKTKVNNRTVTASYFTTARIPLRAGRLFEVRPGRHEAVVNETFARKFFPGVSPIGQFVSLGLNREKKPEWIEITGVVGDLRLRGDAAVAPPEVFHSYEHSYWPMLTFVLRTTTPIDRLAPAIREEIRLIDPNQLVDGIDTMEGALGAALSTPRAITTVAVSFALVALALALIGLYGVLASDVHQRQREFGVRLALGATRGEILWQSLRRGALLAAGGITLGIAASFALNRFLSGMLFGVEPLDPRWLGGATFLLLVAAAAAVARPAWTGASVDPAVTLRHE